ncbi:unnamed protein product [Fraxinus pennsylvanica]|uniref:CBS domain-containing protein n=1 Tax=Fraxinus pennsylvanica TaxID=56036 RepID=A0AAD2DZF6_9LAMI|nr:unnamed protein product [Fraxinus pennsylvanica]
MHVEPYTRQMVAGDVCSGPLITFSGVEKVSNILHTLRMMGHNGFPVIDEPPLSNALELCGLVLRMFYAFDFAKPGSGKEFSVEDLDISHDETEMYVDLHLVTNTSLYTVVETMSLAKASVLFRQLGLRHLCVVPKTPEVRNFVILSVI